jgi:type II secretory pathway pseudopilin PulG
MNYVSANRRAGLSLLETIVVVAIIAILISLLLPAIQQVRLSAQRAKSSNNIRQICLAMHGYANDNENALPRVDGYSPQETNQWSHHIMLLPYLEQGNAYDQFKANSLSSTDRGVNLHSDKLRLSIFEDPADPTLSNIPNGQYSVCSYPANAVVFKPGMKLGSSIPDGTSNTIAYATKYAWNCRGKRSNWTKSNISVYPDSVIWPATFVDEALGAMIPQSPGEYPEETFQIQPRANECDPRLPHSPHSPHSGGMLVALLDGSVKFLSATTSPQVYWAVISPAGGETLSPDW